MLYPTASNEPLEGYGFRHVFPDGYPTWPGIFPDFHINAEDNERKLEELPEHIRIQHLYWTLARNRFNYIPVMYNNKIHDKIITTLYGEVVISSVYGVTIYNPWANTLIGGPLPEGYQVIYINGVYYGGKDASLCLIHLDKIKHAPSCYKELRKRQAKAFRHLEELPCSCKSLLSELMTNGFITLMPHKNQEPFDILVRQLINVQSTANVLEMIINSDSDFSQEKTEQNVDPSTIDAGNGCGSDEVIDAFDNSNESGTNNDSGINFEKSAEPECDNDSSEESGDLIKDLGHPENASAWFLRMFSKYTLELQRVIRFEEISAYDIERIFNEDFDLIDILMPDFVETESNLPKPESDYAPGDGESIVSEETFEIDIEYENETIYVDCDKTEIDVSGFSLDEIEKEETPPVNNDVPEKKKNGPMDRMPEKYRPKNPQKFIGVINEFCDTVNLTQEELEILANNAELSEAQVKEASLRGLTKEQATEEYREAIRSKIKGYVEEHNLSPDEMANAFLRVWKNALYLTINTIDNHVLKDGAFSRNGAAKISVQNLIMFVLSLDNSSAEKNVFMFFKGCDSPSAAAVNKARSKISEELFGTLFYYYNEELLKEHQRNPFLNTYLGYLLLGCDGSDLNIYGDPEHPEYRCSNGNKKPYYQVHLNCLSDKLNHIMWTYRFTTKHKTAERLACCEMVNEFSSLCDIPFLVICDRGYESWATFVNLCTNKREFLIRIKDSEKKDSILRTIDKWETLDRNFDIIMNIRLSRKQKFLNDCENGKIIKSDQYCPYLDNNDYYDLTLRVVQFELQNGNLETIVTTIPTWKLNAGELRNLYFARWGASEGGFFQLKYVQDVRWTHSWKHNLLMQEIQGKIVLHNLVGMVARHMTIAPSRRQTSKYRYQIKLTAATMFVRQFLRGEIGVRELCKRTARELTPIRPDRVFPRNVIPQTNESFFTRG